MAHALKAQKTSVPPFIPGSMSMTQIFLGMGLMLLRSCLVCFLSVDQIAFSEYIRAISNLSSKTPMV
jgi:hypothetical protein